MFSKDHTESLIDVIHQCDYPVPQNMSVDGYQGCNNCSCASCDYACTAPQVNAAIGFFDGFDGALVGIVYGVLIAFSIIFQLFRHFCFKKKNESESSSEDKNEYEDDKQGQSLLEPQGRVKSQ